MLGLATHEPYFTILREEFKPNTPRPCEICNQYGKQDCSVVRRGEVTACQQFYQSSNFFRSFPIAGHSMKECTGEARLKQGEVS